VSVEMTRVRELAGWDLDEDEYRPKIIDGSRLDLACVCVATRAPYEAESALSETNDRRLSDRFAMQQSRADLHAEMVGLDWFLGVVDLRHLLAFQRRLILHPDAPHATVPAAHDWDALMQLCFGEPKPLVCEALWSDTSVVLRSSNPNLHFRVTRDSSSPIAIHTGSPFFEVALYRDRWFLRDGYHRAFQCLQAGIFCLPAVIVRARTLEELGAIHPWFFPEKILFSSTPPRVIDFLKDELVIEYNRSPLIKTLRITIEETYTLQGENI
jgi:hypothetical protein